MYFNNNADSYSFLKRQSQSLSLQVEIVMKEQNLYKQGRKLANQMYAKKWGTQDLIDDNDYGIVVSCSNKIVGNVNLQIKHHESDLLHSEMFFCKRHWKDYVNIADNDLAEISGLCISDDIPQSLSRPVIMGLVLGLQLLHNSLKIRYLTTIQHDYLIRILQKGLNLPFFRNEIITVPQGKIPEDNYWKRKKKPKIYYIDGYSLDAIKACASLFCYLYMAGYCPHFLAENFIADINYPSFWRTWNQTSTLKLAS